MQFSLRTNSRLTPTAAFTTTLVFAGTTQLSIAASGGGVVSGASGDDTTSSLACAAGERVTLQTTITLGRMGGSIPVGTPLAVSGTLSISAGATLRLQP